MGAAMKSFIVALAFLTAACSDITVIEPTITSFDIEAPTTSLFPGDSVTLTPVMQTENGKFLTVDQPVWSSTDSSVVQVSSTGRAMAINPGEATVTLRY